MEERKLNFLKYKTTSKIWTFDTFQNINLSPPHLSPLDHHTSVSLQSSLWCPTVVLTTVYYWYCYCYYCSTAGQCLLGGDTFSKLWLFAKQKLNYNQLVAPKYFQNWAKIIFNQVTLHILFTIRDYKGEIGQNIYLRWCNELLISPSMMNLLHLNICNKYVYIV